MLITVLIASFLVMLMALSGKLLVWRSIGPIIERHMHFLVSFAAGVLLVIAFGLAAEIAEHAGSLTQGLPWIIAGALLVLVAFRYLPDFHHHHEQGAHRHSTIDARRILLSDGIHNIGDGVVIVASFAASPILGIATTVSIMVHEMLQEISEFFVLREAGLSTNRALLYNFLVAGTVLIGTFGAFFLLDTFEGLEVPLLGLAAGSYLIVVFHDLIPHSLNDVRGGRHYLSHALYFLAGILLMTGLIAFLPHAEPEHAEEAATGEMV